MLRHPAVAGQFYKGSSESLKKQVSEFIIPHASRIKALGILSPHAGLIYSGSVAGAVYSRIELPDTFVLIGPNHTGLGAPISLMARGAWETPLGTVGIDEGLAALILSKSPRIQEDSLAHLREHSLEVQLPFIQYLKQDFKIVPIQMLDTRLDTCQEVGRAVAAAIRESSQESGVRSQGEGQKERRSAEGNSEPRTPNSKLPLIIASSDMSHYERAAVAKEKDFKALHHILNLDPEALYRTIKKDGITMCGFGPAVAMLIACKILGATKAELIKYANSGEVSGDFEQVVGYAGVIIA
jgi:predicted class III extradiol MEMO1 family dioxygenase